VSYVGLWSVVGAKVIVTESQEDNMAGEAKVDAEIIYCVP